MFCSSRYRLHRADAAVAEHHVRKQWSQPIHRELCPSPVSSAPMFGVFAINLLCVSACFLRSFTWPGTFPSSSHLRSFTTSFVFPSFPVGMIASQNSQNLRLHSAEHYKQTNKQASKQKNKQTNIHYITLHYIALHYITLHYTTLHYITFTLHTYIPSFHTSSFFVTHGLSHTTLSHTTVLTSRSFTTSFVFPSFPATPSRYNICCSWSTHTHTHTPHTQLITAQLPHTRVPCCTRQSLTISFLFPAFPMPSLPFFCCLLEEVGMWGYPVL